MICCRCYCRFAPLPLLLRYYFNMGMRWYKEEQSDEEPCGSNETAVAIKYQLSLINYHLSKE